MAKKSVEVSLRGQSFSVRSERDEATVHAIAHFVSRKFDELGRQASRRSPHELALLVALNIAEDLFDSEDRARALRHELRERSERILARIDEALETVPEGDGEHEQVAAVPATVESPRP
jgi:cell division protein ZapA